MENLSQPIVLNIFSSQPDPSLPLGTSRYTYLNQAQFFLENVVFSETVYLFLCNITCLLCLRSQGGYYIENCSDFFSEYNLLTRSSFIMHYIDFITQNKYLLGAFTLAMLFKDPLCKSYQNSNYIRGFVTCIETSSLTDQNNSIRHSTQQAQ